MSDQGNDSMAFAENDRNDSPAKRASEARAEWRKPTVTRISAGGAELGFTNTKMDGKFSKS